MSIKVLEWRDRPSLIERLLPAQKISAEAQKERKAGAGQTLTALGSYWKGRKPLILVKACVLGALLPATDDAEADLAIFEKLMAIDDESFLRREVRAGCLELVKRLHPRGEMSAADAERLFEVRVREVVNGKPVWIVKPFSVDEVEDLGRGVLVWRNAVTQSERFSWQLEWVRSLTYLERVAMAKRPEELDQAELFKPVWAEVNKHLGTDACSLPDLVEQLGILRFGHRPRVGDTFCGGGSIPFEAARLGCDVDASDLNPIACMLTWGALNVIGAHEARRREIEAAQAELAAAVDREITELGIEHDREGNRAKAYLYCVEVRCPQTGWMVPLAPSWVISRTKNVVARLVPNPERRRFEIEIASGVSAEELEEANQGTIRGGQVVYSLNGETVQTEFKTIRGDTRRPDGTTENKLRKWEKEDFVPRPDDILQERLYCVQWATRETLATARPATFFASVTADDLARERRAETMVRESLSRWQSDPCPECCEGRVYRQKEPKTLIRIVGQAPLKATVFEMERLRCNGCCQVFTAAEPAGVGAWKYDMTAVAMIALLKYGTGMPFNRMELLETQLGIPLPAATQWGLMEQAAGLLKLILDELIRQAAQGSVVHNDDTGMRILKLLRNTDDGRTGTFTSGIVSIWREWRIALYFTGWKHAGENLADVLKHRAAQRDAPIQMCDALSRNAPRLPGVEVLLANCLAHGRRQIVDVAANFPEECRYVLETLGKVYQTDAQARERQLSPESRLLLHQEHSAPLLDELREWMATQFAEHKTEPNSGLGKAISYLQRHWTKLTLFLRQPGAPLDNNIAERMLKKAILHRKNALFYKTMNGARVGDLFMSLIHTCELNKANPFDYLTELLRHPVEMKASPAEWMPWNYRMTLAGTATQVAA